MREDIIVNLMIGGTILTFIGLGMGMSTVLVALGWWIFLGGIGMVIVGAFCTTLL